MTGLASLDISGVCCAEAGLSVLYTVTNLTNLDISQAYCHNNMAAKNQERSFCRLNLQTLRVNGPSGQYSDSEVEEREKRSLGERYDDTSVAICEQPLLHGPLPRTIMWQSWNFTGASLA